VVSPDLIRRRTARSTASRTAAQGESGDAPIDGSQKDTARTLAVSASKTRALPPRRRCTPSHRVAVTVSERPHNSSRWHPHLAHWQVGEGPGRRERLEARASSAPFHDRRAVSKRADRERDKPPLGWIPSDERELAHQTASAQARATTTPQRAPYGPGQP